MPQCIDRARTTVVSTNYDIVMDNALFLADSPNLNYGVVVRAAVHRGPVPDAAVRAGELRYFVVRPDDPLIRMGPIPLLKLHGSLNWRLTLRAQSSFTMDALVHHEDWSGDPSRAGGTAQERVERHLAPGRFIAPPLLAKTAVAERPILGRLWSVAYQELERAERVVFLGYSLPPADVAAAFLFREACGDLRPAQVQVINLAPSEEARREVCAAYRRVFPNLPDAQFVFQDVREWTRAWRRHA